MRFGGGTHQTEDPTLRRLLSAAAVAALSIGLLVPAADAATTTTSYNYLPTGWSAKKLACSTGTVGSDSIAHVTGPSAPPSGTGSLKVSVPVGSLAGIGEDFSTAPALSTLTGLSAQVYYSSATASTPGMRVIASDANYAYEFGLSPDTSLANSWVNLDGSGSLGWTSINLHTGDAGPSGQNTIADFATAHPGTVLRSVSITAGDCDPSAAAFYVDDLSLTVGSDSTTTDFEAPTPTAFTNGSHPSSVLTGTAVTLSATLKTNGVALANQSVGLYLKGTGSKSYKLATTLVTNSNGAVSYKVAPSSTTSYQWRFASSSANQYAPANASSFTITTRQKVAISSKPTSVSYRGTATIKGRVMPYKSGVTVRLVRIVSGKRIVVASARTTTGGYFTIKAPMTVRGTYAYVVTAVAYTGEAQGQSPSFKITTR